jgi:hypothetical protein
MFQPFQVQQQEVQFWQSFQMQNLLWQIME